MDHDEVPTAWEQFLRRPAAMEQVRYAVRSVVFNSRIAKFIISGQAGVFGFLVLSPVTTSIALDARKLAKFFLDSKPSPERAGRKEIHWSMVTDGWDPPTDEIARSLQRARAQASQLHAHMLDRIELEALGGYLVDGSARDVCTLALRFANHLTVKGDPEGERLASSVEKSIDEEARRPDSFFRMMMPDGPTSEERRVGGESRAAS